MFNVSVNFKDLKKEPDHFLEKLEEYLYIEDNFR